MKPFLILLSFVAAAHLTASIDPIDLIVEADPTSKTVVVRTTTELNAPTSLRILNAFNGVVHTTQVDSGNFVNLRFHLAALQPGDYRILVADARGETAQPVRITADGLTADPSLALRKVYPRVSLRDNKLLTINYPNHGGDRVSLRVTDAQGNEIITDRIRGAEPVRRGYDLTQLPAGDYFVTVYSPDIDNYRTSIHLE